MKKYLILLATVVLVSCNQSKITEMQTTIASLRDSLNILTEQLNAYRSSPEKLCANVEKLYQDENLAELERIDSVLSIYHPESAEATVVSNLISKLETTFEKRAEAEKQKRLKAVTKLKKNYDDVSGITWYYNPYFTHYNDINSMSLYIGQKQNDIWLRLRMSYEGDDWIFFEKAYISYEGNTIEIPFDRYRDKESDNSGGSVWEWIDVPVSDAMLKFLTDASKSNDIKMRLSGKYTKTRNLSYNERQALKDMLLAYDVLLKEADTI